MPNPMHPVSLGLVLVAGLFLAAICLLVAGICAVQTPLGPIYGVASALTALVGVGILLFCGQEDPEDDDDESDTP